MRSCRRSCISGHDDAEMGRRALSPALVDGFAVAPDDGHRPQHLGRLEPGGVDDDVDRMTHPVPGSSALVNGCPAYGLRTNRYLPRTVLRAQLIGGNEERYSRGTHVLEGEVM